MKKSIIFLGLLIALICLVGTVAGATQTLTVVYDTSGQHSYAMESGGVTYYTVKSPDNTYHYYAPSTDDLLSASLSGGTWQVLYQYEYVQFDNSVYVDTGYKPTGDTQITGSVYLLSSLSSSAYLFGSQSTTGNSFYVKPLSSTTAKLEYEYGTTVDTSNTQLSVNTLYTINIDKNVWNIGGKTKTFTYKSFSVTNRNMRINGAGKASMSESDRMNFRLYSFTIYNDGELLRDYQPIKYGSTYTLLDKKNNQILTSTEASSTNQLISGTLSGGGTSSAMTYQHTVSSPPSISIQTQPTSTVAVNTAISSVAQATAGAGGTLTYQWSVSSGGAYTDISGQTSATLSYTPASIGIYTFKCTVTESTTQETANATTNSVRVVTSPSIGDLSYTIGGQSQTTGKVGTSYSLLLSFPVTDMGGAEQVNAYVYEYIGGSRTLINYFAVNSVSTRTYTATVNDQTATEHQYKVEVYSNGFGDLYAFSNYVSFQTYAPPTTPTISISPSSITVNTATTVTLSSSDVPQSPAGNPYTYTWYYGNSATPSGSDTVIGTWTDISQSYSWNIGSTTFSTIGTKYVYLKITDSLSQTVNSNSATLSIVSITASVQWATEYHGMSDNINMVISGHQSGNTYVWYYQQVGSSTWNSIGTSTDATYTKTPTQIGLTSGNSYKFKAVVNTLDLEASAQLTPYATPIPNTPGAPLTPVAIPYTITLTASCSNENTVQSYKWQLQNGESWQDVSTGAQYSPTITTAGNHVYRFVAIGKNGYSVNSASVTVQAGYKPSATITTPATGSQFNAGERINVGATVGGTQATYTWNFGSGVSSQGTTTGTINAESTTITSYVEYTSEQGHKTITLTVSNIYGTSAVYTITVENGKSSARPTAHSTVAPVNSSGIYNLINNANPISTENALPNLSGMVGSLTNPITSIIGEWFYLIIFAVPYLILFLRQKNILIPSILGVLFATFLLVLLPAVALRPAIGILVISIAGGIFGLYVKRHS